MELIEFPRLLTYEIEEQAKTVRWYNSINSRFILEDFFAKIEYYFG